MKVILVGHEGSRKILKASMYLTGKYLPFETTYLNYGGEISGWSEFIASHLRKLEDKKVIFALDDYLLSSPLDETLYEILLNQDVVCARLCDSSFYPKYVLKDGIMWISGQDYTATTQYCIWDREFLIELLGQVKTPWEFEIEGSKYLNSKGKVVIGTVKPALEYPTSSCLSRSWNGIKVSENNKEDIQYLVEHGYLNKDELI